MKDTFRVVPNEDFPKMPDTGYKEIRYSARRINHPKFKHMSMKAAVEYIQQQPLGDFVIRPSSKGGNYLSITWKF